MYNNKKKLHLSNIISSTAFKDMRFKQIIEFEKMVNILYLKMNIVEFIEKYAK